MRAVVFDLDGTLIDSLPDIASSVNVSLAARGLAALPADAIETMIGDGAKVLLTKAFAARGAEMTEADLAAFVTYYTAHSADETAPYPGIVDALRDLRAAGHPLGVCTNKPAVAAREVLASLKLDEFFDVVTGGDATPYKQPDPRHLEAAVTALGASEAVMVGDHYNDIAAAAGLGIPAIFAAWGYGSAESLYVARNAAELPGLIKDLPAGTVPQGLTEAAKKPI
jgi:phosphoglycolate phosphatase